MTGQEYVDSLRIRLDRLSDQNEIYTQLQQAVIKLHEAGYTDDEIKKLFQREYICHAQESAKMIKNHEEYRKMVARILGEKKS